jgi:cysteine synthase
MSSNIKVSVKGSIATITIDLAQNLGPSKSGKTVLVATTSGNVNIPGTDVTLGLNAYRKAS